MPGNVDAETCAGSNRLLKEGAGVLTSGWDLAEEYRAFYPDKIKEKRSRSKAEWDETTVDVLAQISTKTEKNGEAEGKKVFDKASAIEYIDLITENGEASPDELAVLKAIGNDTMQIDDIISASKIPAHKVLAAMTMLEIKGIVSQESGNKFRINLSSK